MNDALNTALCTWEDLTLEYGGSCTATPPPEDMMFVIILVMLTLVISVPLSFVFDFVMTTYCAKRPDLKKWGYNTEAILGRSTQSLGEFNTDKLSAPIVALRKEVALSREALGVSARFHSEDYMKSGARQSAQEREVNDVNTEAREVYDEFNGVAEEVEEILDGVITFLTVTLRNQTVPWHTHTGLGVSASAALQLNAAKIGAIEDQLGVRADGTPVPLTILEYLCYGNARAKLESKIEDAREKERDIVDVLVELGENELLSKDEALTQFFVLEQFSVFKQYALRSQLFSFAATTALPVDPLYWVVAWAFILGSLLFFLYWTLMWGVRAGPTTVEGWGTNFAVAVVQDLFMVQVFKLYVLYMISAICIKPQLTAIYKTLQRLAIEYVQDELPDAFGVIRVVQHLSPACRVAKLKISDSLAAGQILRHIDDRYISNFRIASHTRLPFVFFAMVAVPVIAGMVSEAAGDLLLDTVLPSVASTLILAHYLLWKVSPLLVVVPYAALGALVVTRRRIYLAADLRVQDMRRRVQARRELRSLAGWHTRSGRVFPQDDSYLTSVQQYFTDLLRRYHTWWVDATAKAAVLIGSYQQLPRYAWERATGLREKESAANQWRSMNTPLHLHGGILQYRDLVVAESRMLTSSVAPQLPPEVRRMAKDVTGLWDLHGEGSGDGEGTVDEAQEGAVAQCATAAKGYLLRVLGIEGMELTAPAQLEGAEAAAEVGTVLAVGWRSYARAPIGSALAREFRDKYGFCTTSKRALARVIGSYRQQLLEGTSLV